MSPITYRKTPWGFDPTWLRVEAFDEEGQSLGTVTFEFNELQPASTSSFSSQIWRISASLRSMVRWAMPSFSATSTVS